MAWRSAVETAPEESTGKPEDQTRSEYERATKMVAELNELLKGAGIKKNDWLTGKASLIGASVAETPAGVPTAV